MTYSCAFCEKPGYYQKYFVCPSTIWRPSMYTICKEHHDQSISYYDVYPEDGSSPELRISQKLMELKNDS